MDEYIASSVAAPRFNTTLLSIFAGVALVLTIVGLYGVMSYRSHSARMKSEFAWHWVRRPGM